METFSALLALCAGNSPVPVNSPHKGQWRGALIFSLICAWINDWVNNRETDEFRRHRGHYDVNAMDITALYSLWEVILQQNTLTLMRGIVLPNRRIYIHFLRFVYIVTTQLVEKAFLVKNNEQLFYKVNTMAAIIGLGMMKRKRREVVSKPTYITAFWIWS